MRDAGLPHHHGGRLHHRGPHGGRPAWEVSEPFRLYLRYASLSMRAQLQYPASFLMQTLGHFLITGVDFIAVLSLFGRFGSLKGWTLPEVSVFYGLITMAFAVADMLTRGIDAMGSLVKRGEFDRLLLRPRTVLLQLLGYEFTLRRLGRFLQGAIVFAYGALVLPVHFTPARVLVMGAAFTGSALVFMGLLLIQATAAFWTTESLEIFNAMTYGGIETAQYPVSIYRDWFRRFFTFVVPLACVNYFPILFILGKPDPLGSPVWFQVISPAAGVLFFLVGLLFFRFGIRHYTSTGS